MGGPAAEFVRKTVAEEVPGAVKRALEEQVKGMLDPITDKLKEITERQAEQAKTEVIDPNEARWMGAQVPEPYKRAVDQGGWAGQYIPSGDGGLYFCPDEEARAVGYRAPANKSLMGVRGARVIRAYVASGFREDRVAQVLADKYKDKESAKLCERALETGESSLGGLTIMHPLLASEFIPFLSDVMATMQLGAREFTMGSGGAIIPGLKQGVNGGWIGELTENNAELPRLFSKKMSSKKAYALVAISRDLLEESSMAIDMMVRDDLIRALATVLENAIINGPGTEHSPRGVFLDNEITKLQLNSGSGRFLTSDDPIDFETTLQEQKIDFTGRRMGYLMNPRVFGQFRKMKTTTGDYLYLNELGGANPSLLGIPARWTTLIANGGDANESTKMLFGDFMEILIGVTRAMMIEQSNEATYLDSNGNKRSGFIQEVSLLKITKKCDVLLRQSEAMLAVENIHTVAA